LRGRFFPLQPSAKRGPFRASLRDLLRLLRFFFSMIRISLVERKRLSFSSPHRCFQSARAAGTAAPLARHRAPRLVSRPPPKPFGGLRAWECRRGRPAGERRAERAGGPWSARMARAALPFRVASAAPWPSGVDRRRARREGSVAVGRGKALFRIDSIFSSGQAYFFPAEGEGTQRPVPLYQSPATITTTSGAAHCPSLSVTSLFSFFFFCFFQKFKDFFWVPSAFAGIHAFRCKRGRPADEWVPASAAERPGPVVGRPLNT